MFLHLRRLTIFLILGDAIATQLALWLADLARRVLPFGQPLDSSLSQINPVLQVVVGLIFPVTFLALSVYDVRRGGSALGDPTNIFRAVSVATFVFAGALYFSFRDVSRLLVVYFFFLDLAGLAGVRLVAWLWLRHKRQQGRALARVLLVGAGEIASAVVKALRAKLGDSVQIIGCVAVERDAEAGPEGIPVLGRIEQLSTLVRSHTADEVIVALPSEQHALIEQLEYELLTEPVRVRLVPDYMRLVFVQSSVESLNGIPLIGLREPRITGVTWAVKRLFDVGVTLFLVLLTWPIMLAIAVAIKLNSPGPVIFKQRRVGENGRLFQMYKFRTMISDADMRRPEVVLDDQGRQVYKAPEDRRVTRVGRFLRQTSLDEMPQFWNVLKGEMSLVGPRPEMEFIVEKYEPWQRQRLAVPPGITGWWQVNGRSDLPMHLNTHLDLYYIRNYSLWLDILILWKTVGAVLRRQGAY
jgi:exopolysaccharide biosynthesis polyprenyl glycosylphosphotransferase